MRGGLIAAWLFGSAIVVWRDVHVQHRIPAPGQLLGISALFLGLAAVSEYSKAAGLATAVGWGLDVAALLNVLPEGLGKQIGQAESAGTPRAAAATAGEGAAAAGEGSGGRL